MKIKHKKWIAIISSFILIVTFVVAGVSGVGDNLLMQVDERSNQEGFYEAIEETMPEKDYNNYQARDMVIDPKAYLGIYYSDKTILDSGAEDPSVGARYPVLHDGDTYRERLRFAEGDSGAEGSIFDGIKSPGTGYYFKGWYYYDSTNKIVSDEKIELDQVIINDEGHHAGMVGDENQLPYVDIIEVWSNEYKVNLDGNGGTLSTDQITVKYDHKYGECSDIFKEGFIQAPEGKHLAGWSWDESATSIDVSPETVVKLEDPNNIPKLYAVWVDNSYNLTFNYNYPDSQGPDIVEWDKFNGKGTYEEIMEANDIPRDPTRTGYDFTGWYTDATGGTKVELETTVSSNNDTLFAHWTEKTYTITYNIDGTEITGTEWPNSYKYTTESVTLPTPEKYGYIFHGWYTSKGLSGDPITEFKPAIEKGPITFFGMYLTKAQDELYNEVVKIENGDDMTPLELFNAKVSAVVHYEQNLEENPGFTIGENYDNIIKGYKKDIEYINHNSTVGGLVLEGIDKWFVGLDVEELSDSNADFQSIASQVDADVIIRLYDINLMDVRTAADQNEWAIYNLEAGETAIIKIPQDLFDTSGYENIRWIHQDSKTSEIEILDYDIQDGYYIIELSSFSPVGIIADIIEQPGAANSDSGMYTDADGNTGAAVDASGKNAMGGYTQTGDSLPIFEIAIFAIAGVAILLVVIVKHKRFTH